MVFILTKYKQENINIYSTLSVLLDRLMNIFLFWDINVANIFYKLVKIWLTRMTFIF